MDLGFRCDACRLVNVSVTFITNAAGVTLLLCFVFKELVDGVRLRDRSTADVYLKTAEELLTPQASRAFS